jgi:hypothetical protein
MNFSRQLIPAINVQSLTWHADTLVDLAGGGNVFHLDGRREASRMSWAFPFDAACAAADRRFVVIYQRLGTKALLLRDGKILRELNRSFYHAHVYEYPVCIWQAADGRTLLAHCPEDYCRIDIEDAESGKRLTEGVRKPEDFFHSRLCLNPAGTRLLSAGWVWHPFDCVAYYDVAEALRDPAHLDSVEHYAPLKGNTGLVEESFACWQTNDRVLVGTSDTLNENDPEPRVHPYGIAVYDLASRSFVQSVGIGEVSGPLMPLGQNHAVCFYRHPKIVDLRSGEVVARWEDIDTGNQRSSILYDSQLPPLAMDVEHRRFAVFGPQGITVVELE